MKEFQNVIQNFLKNHEKHKKYLALLTVLSLVVSFTVSMGLIKPAVSMTREFSCDMQEHIHSAECYELSCGTEESEEHSHSSDCYTLICNTPEHIHSDVCYSNNEQNDDMFADISPDAVNINYVGGDWFDEVQNNAPTNAKAIDRINSVGIKYNGETYNQSSTSETVTINITDIGDNNSASASFTLNYSITSPSTTFANNNCIYYQLPNGIKIQSGGYSGSTMTVLDNGNVAGYYSISDSGLIVIKLTDDYIESHKNDTTLTGSITFNGTIERASSIDGDVDLAVGGYQFKFNFPDKNFGLEKTGEILNDLSANGKPQIKWTIKVDNEYNSSTLKGWTLSDTDYSFPANGTGVTVTPTGLGEFDASGNFTFTADSYTERYTTFEFTTEVDYDGTTDKTVNNNAKLSKDGTEIPASTSKTLNKMSLTKSGTPDYQNGTMGEKINWTIDVNNPYKVTLNGYSVQDDKLIGSNVTLKDSSGNIISSDGYNFDSSSGTITINSDIKDAVKIEYITDVSRTAYTNATDGSTYMYKDITNSAVLKKDSTTVDTKTSTVQYKKEYKLEKSGSPDYSSGGSYDKVNWTINVGYTNGSSLNGFTIEDAAFADTTNTTNIVVKNGDTTLTQGTDYTISGNTMTISNTSVKEVTITYTTDLTNVTYDTANRKKTANNNVKLKTNDNEEFTKDVSVEYHNQYNLSKSGTYDAVSDKITWTVNASTKDQGNNKKVVLDNYTLTDPAFASVNLSQIVIDTSNTKFDWQDLSVLSQTNDSIVLGKVENGSNVTYATITKNGSTITINSANPSDSNSIRGIQSLKFSYTTDKTGDGLTSSTENGRSYVSNGIGDNRSNSATGKADVTERHEITKTLNSSSEDTIQVTGDTLTDTTKVLDWTIQVIEDGGFSGDSKVLVDTMSATNNAEHYLDVGTQTGDIKVYGKINNTDTYTELTLNTDYSIVYKDSSGTAISNESTDKKAKSFEITFNNSIDSANYRYIKVDYKTTADYSNLDLPSGDNQSTAEFSNTASFNNNTSNAPTYKVILNDASYVTLVTVNISKNWVGDTNTQSSRPTSITYLLQRKEGTDGTWKTIYKNTDEQWVEVAEGDTTDHSFTLSSSMNWSYSFDDLPSETSDHTKQYYYQVIETNVDSDYKASYTGNDVQSGNIAITNTKKQDFTKTAIDKKSNAITEIDTQNLDTVSYNGTDYYAIGWKLDFGKTNGAITLTDTLSSGMVLLQSYDKGEKDSWDGALKYPAIYKTTNWGADVYYDINSNTGDDDVYTVNEQTVTFEVKAALNSLSIVYYTGIPKETLDNAINTNGYYIASNTAEIVGDNNPKTQSLIITGSSSSASDANLLKKNVGNADVGNSVFQIDGGNLIYSVYVNPDGRYISNTDMFDITDKFNINSFAGSSSGLDAIDAELSEVKVEEINNIETDENGNITSASTVRTLGSNEYQYIVDLKPRKTIQLNPSSSYSDPGSISISDADNNNSTLQQEVTITFQITGTPNGTWSGTIDGNPVTLNFDESGFATYDWTGYIRTKHTWDDGYDYSQNYAKTFAISSMTDSSTGASITGVSAQNVDLGLNLNFVSDKGNTDTCFYVKDANATYISVNIDFKIKGTPNSTWIGTIGGTAATLNFNSEGYSVDSNGNVIIYNKKGATDYSGCIAITDSISGEWQSDGYAFKSSNNASYITDIEILNACTNINLNADINGSTPKIQVSGINTSSNEDVTMDLIIKGTPNGTWTGTIDGTAATLTFDASGNANYTYTWSGRTSSSDTTKDIEISPKTYNGVQISGGYVKSASYEESNYQATAITTFTVPDGTPLKITYKYTITKDGENICKNGSGNNEKMLIASNEVSLDTGNASSSDSKDNTSFIVNESQADIGGDKSPQIVKYDVGNYGIKLDAKFLIAEYDTTSNTWKYSSAESEGYVTKSDGTQVFDHYNLTFDKTDVNQAQKISTGGNNQDTGVYKLSLTSNKLYMIVEVVAPEGYEGADTSKVYKIGDSEYTGLENLMKAYLSAEDKTAFNNSEYGNLIKNFINYFYYDEYSGTLPEGAGVTQDQLIKVKSQSSLDIPNNNLINITANKTWSDNNATGATAKFQLYWSYTRNSSDIPDRSYLVEDSEKTVSAGNGAEWSNLPNGKDGKPVYYYVKETEYTISNKTYKLDTSDGKFYEWDSTNNTFAVDESDNKIKGNYMPTYTGNAANTSGNVTVLNSQGMYIKKEWKNSDGTVMTSIPSEYSSGITVQFKATATGVTPLIKTITLKPENNWSVLLSDILENGEDLSKYTSFEVTETTTLYNYIVSVNKKLTGSVGEITVINKDNTPTSVDVSVNKVWSDDWSTHTSDSVTVKLYKSTRSLTDAEVKLLTSTIPSDLSSVVSEVSGTDITNPVTLNNSTQNYTWENLPYKSDSNQRYYYYPVETSSISGYITNYTRVDRAASQDVTITNSLPKSITINKSWVDSEGNTITSNLPESIKVELYKRLQSSAETVTPATTNTVKIMALGDSITDGYWDGSSQGYRKYLYHKLHDTIGYTIDMVGSRNSSWSTDYTFSDGTYSYDAAYEGYSGYAIKAYTGRSGLLETIQTSGSGNSAISTYSPDIVLLMIGTNDILDDHNISSPTGDTIKDRLQALVNEIYTQKSDVKLLIMSPPPINSAYGWSGQGGDFPAQETMDSDINAYKTVIQEIVNAEKTNGKSCEYVDINGLFNSQTDYKDYLYDYCHPSDSGYKLMGEYLADVVHSYLSNGTIASYTSTSSGTVSGTDISGYPNDLNAAEKVDNYTITPNDSGNWSLNITNLEEGYVYYIKEKDTNGWTASYTHNGQLGGSEQAIQITNTKVVEKTSITVKKNWFDGNSSNRPNVTVKLMRKLSGTTDDFTEVTGKSATLSNSNNWTYTWNDIPKYGSDDTTEYLYKVEEVVPDGYIAAYSNNDGVNSNTAESPIEITNTKSIDLTINKTWADGLEHNSDTIGVEIHRSTNLNDVPAVTTITESSESGESSETQTTTVTANVGSPDSDGNILLNFGQAIGNKVVLDLNVANVNDANGSLQIRNLVVDGTTYNIQYNWNYSGNNIVEVSLNSSNLNAIFNSAWTDITSECDDTLKNKIIEASQNVQNVYFQRWNNKDYVTLNSAYIYTTSTSGGEITLTPSELKSSTNDDGSVTYYYEFTLPDDSSYDLTFAINNVLSGANGCVGYTVHGYDAEGKDTWTWSSSNWNVGESNTSGTFEVTIPNSTTKSIQFQFWYGRTDNTTVTCTAVKKAGSGETGSGSGDTGSGTGSSGGEGDNNKVNGTMNGSNYEYCINSSSASYSSENNTISFNLTPADQSTIINASKTNVEFYFDSSFLSSNNISNYKVVSSTITAPNSNVSWNWLFGESTSSLSNTHSKNLSDYTSASEGKNGFSISSASTSPITITLTVQDPSANTISLSSYNGNDVNNVSDAEPVSVSYASLYGNSINMTADTITFNANGVAAIQSIGSSDSWTKTISSLPAYDSNGSPYYYWVVETKVNGTNADSAYNISYQFTDSTSSGNAYCIDGSNGNVTIKNTNKESSDTSMPSTGGTGTSPYKTLGIVMIGVSAAGMVLVRRRRKA